MKVLITGGNGFIGSHVVDYFLSKKINVSCLVRPNSNLDNLNGKNVNLIYGDIRDYDSIEDKINSHTYVIHIAGYAKDWGDYETFYQTNVVGTMNILKACYNNKIPDILITSSCSVYGEENSNLKKNEESICNSHYKYFLDNIFPCKMNYYRDTKRLAKIAAMKFAEEKNLNVTFIEPVWVYGEREFNTGFYEYLYSAKSMPFFPGSKKNKFHVIYVKDLVKAYYLSFQKKLKGMNSFLIGNEKIEFMNRIYTLFCNEAGIKKPLNIPKLIIYPIAFIIELFYTLLNIKSTPILTRGRVNMFYDNIEYSIDKSKNILKFKQEFTLEEGIKKTVAWYKANNYI